MTTLAIPLDVTAGADLTVIGPNPAVANQPVAIVGHTEQRPLRREALIAGEAGPKAAIGKGHVAQGTATGRGPTVVATDAGVHRGQLTGSVRSQGVAVRTRPGVARRPSMVRVGEMQA